MGALVETQPSLPGIPAPERYSSGNDYIELIRLGASPEIVQQFMDLRDREQARQAKLAFTQAKAQFAAEEIRISKDKVNKQYGSNYTSIGNMVNTVRPFLGQHGFDIRWEIDQSNETEIRVTCVLTHELGHSERVMLIVPPDVSGQKNPLQQVKSAVTYARILTFEAVCGLASADGAVNVDDDGNSAYRKPQTQAQAIPEGQHMDAARLGELLEWLDNAKDRKELDSMFRTGYQEASKLRDHDSMKVLISKKDQVAKEKF